MPTFNQYVPNEDNEILKQIQEKVLLKFDKSVSKVDIVIKLLKEHANEMLNDVDKYFG